MPYEADAICCIAGWIFHAVARPTAMVFFQESPRNTEPRCSSPPVHVEVIRRRAYEFYEQPGREDGHAEEDWLGAETEVLGTAFESARVG